MSIALSLWKTFIKTNESVTATQRAFRLHFNLGRHDPVPARNTILLWVTNFRATGSALKRKSTGRPRTARTPENVAAVRASVQQSPLVRHLNAPRLIGFPKEVCEEFFTMIFKCINRPRSIEQLKDAIRQEITAIPHEMTRRVIDNFRECLRQCVDNNGSHLTDLIFKT